MAYPNTLQQDKFTMAFSNMPSLENNKQLDTKMYDEYIKSIVLPDMSLEVVNSDFMNDSYKLPNSRANDTLSDVTMEFFVSEDLTNYYNIFNLIKQLRYGMKNPSVDYLRNNTIKAIDIFILNNENENIAKMRFTEALPISVGQLSFDMGNSEDIIFPVSFMYEEVKLFSKEEL